MPDRHEKSFGAELASRVRNGVLEWDDCLCGTRRAKRDWPKLTEHEKPHLFFTGLDGVTKDGSPRLRVLIVKRLFRCTKGHVHEARKAVSLCPFGPSPNCILAHGVPPEWKDGEPLGARTPHCTGPLATSYTLVPLSGPPAPPSKMLPDLQPCPGADDPRRIRT